MNDAQTDPRKGRGYPFEGKAIIGVVHLKPLPGSPGYGGDLDAIHEAALRDGLALCEGGVQGLIIENYGDTPFFPDQVEPHTAAIMAVILSEMRAHTNVPLGVNMLRNDGRSALATALAGKAAFIRVNVFCGAALTDQGIIQGRAHELLRYRKAIGSPAAILADVHVKHSLPMAKGSIEQAAEDAWYRGGADGLIVTGRATGKAISLEDLEKVRHALPDAPLLAGSGVTDESVQEILKFADGAIIGTWLKQGGVTESPVDPARVAKLMKAVRALS